MTYASLAQDPDAALRAALAGEVAGVAIATSGSTGKPRLAYVSGAALRAPAAATHERLGGPGHWLLALPPDRVAGAQVLVRSALGGHPAVRLRPGSFDPRAFAEAALATRSDTAASVPLYVSLVPTQLHRIADDPAAVLALEVFDAILVGGAALRRDVAPPNAIETYGSTETAGGCVYDGRPLPGVEVELEGDGRVLISGPILFDGYADGGDDGTVFRDGKRWLRMPDVGDWADARLAVLGRADDVIVTGAFKVHPATVERAIRILPEIADVVVVAAPDEEWGERIVALVSLADRRATITTDALRTEVADTLPRHALPRQVIVVEKLPHLDSGKIDRRAARALARASNGGPRARDDA
ncbi:MAG TPA: AMP-binding protein [Demequinaceae bacterium]